MNSRQMRYGLGMLAVVACGVACSTSGGAKKGEAAIAEDTLLSPIRTKHLYMVPSDLPQVQLRVALVDTLWATSSGSTVVVGMYRPHDGLFRAETEPVASKSIQTLVAALDRHIDRMPIGIILTVDGNLPTAQKGQPPAAFGAFVSELQQALLKEGIQFAFLLPEELHVVK